MDQLISPEIVHPSISLINGMEDRQPKAFILANTIESSLKDMRSNHIIPVFTKDNETLISHTDFIETTHDIARSFYSQEDILAPQIRLSHPIKGRIPEAKDKPANQLQEFEKTLYYERMMFIIEIPSIRDDVGGNELSLTIGGVKSYSQDNLYSKSLSDQHFKIFIGFKNTVCTNLCIWTDGMMSDVKVKSLGQLKGAIRSLIEGYNQNFHLFSLQQLYNHSITESQFAHLIGRCRMYHNLPNQLKADIPPILLGDQQISTVVKDFYRDNSFCRDDNGNINLWKLYNLFTGANKTSYVDSFLERGSNAFALVDQVRRSLEEKESCWYLN